MRAHPTVGRLNGSQEKRQSTQSPVAPSPAATEADTFRGVHLDPNAHHWDEVSLLYFSSDSGAIDMLQMEEDNDDFLEGVIEFGDGRQYQIQPVDVPQSAEDSVLTAILPPEAPGPVPQSPSTATRINKEDRFSEDFDRSWPRSAALSSNIRPRIGPSAAASTSSNSSLSPQEASRVLFNERSNRLEPWSNNNRIPPPGTSSVRFMVLCGLSSCSQILARVEMQGCIIMYNCCKSKALTTHDVTLVHPKGLRIGAGNGEGAPPTRPPLTRLCLVGGIHPGKACDSYLLT